MKQYIVSTKDEGITLIKYLNRVLPGATSGLLYKQLRKKNITLNSKKADGSERIKAKDEVKVFFADETIEKFSFDNTKVLSYAGATGKVSVLFENEDILALNKGPDTLTQKAKPDDISLNEEMIAYLINEGAISEADLKTVTPSVCNRLDRNTTGIVLCGKTIKGLQWLSKILKERSVHKYYRCIVKGRITSAESYEGYLTKSSSHNQVKISDKPLSKESQYICTKYTPVSHKRVSIPGLKEEVELTMLEVLLVTGRSHQIRAHLASLRHPILGDPKYGDIELNKKIKRVYKINRQLLHAFRVEFPSAKETEGVEGLDMDGRIITCPLPDDMKFMD